MNSSSMQKKCVFTVDLGRMRSVAKYRRSLMISDALPMMSVSLPPPPTLPSIIGFKFEENAADWTGIYSINNRLTETIIDKDERWDEED